MVRRKLRRKKNKKQIRIVLGSLVTMLFILTVGYAAFSTNISLTAKGNVKKQAAATMLKKKVVTSGDGLYADSTENSRYIYRGKDPNNYIMLDTEMYRIIAVESDNTLKVFRRDILVNIPYDALSNQTNRTSETTFSGSSSEYCGYAGRNSTYHGCNIWGSNKTTLDVYGNNTTTMAFDIGGLNGSTNTANKQYTLPATEASANIYLNTTYYNNLSTKIKNTITIHRFYCGPTDHNNTNIVTDVSQEKKNSWKGNIGLINITDYVKADTNSNCKSVSNYSMLVWNTGGLEECYSTKNQYNWMALESGWHTMTPITHEHSRFVHLIQESGSLGAENLSDNANIRPAMFLNSDITLSGEGTEQNPYTID